MNRRLLAVGATGLLPMFFLTYVGAGLTLPVLGRAFVLTSLLYLGSTGKRWASLVFGVWLGLVGLITMLSAAAAGAWVAAVLGAIISGSGVQVFRMSPAARRPPLQPID